MKELQQWILAHIAAITIRWHFPIIAGSIFTCIALFFINQVFQLKELEIYTTLVLIIIIFVLSSIIITSSLRPSKFSKDTIGLLLAIRTEDGDGAARLSSDIFPTFLQSLIKVQPVSFDAKFLTPFHANSITNANSAIEYLNYCGARFLLYGTFSKRKHKREDYFSLKVEAVVTHGTTTVENKDLLGREMAAVITRKSMIAVHDELSGLEFTGNMLGMGAQYIIAMALFISGNLEESIKTLEILRETLEKSRLKMSAGNPKLPGLISRRLLEFKLSYAENEFLRWREDRQIERIENIERIFSGLPNDWKKISFALNLRGICHFILKRNVEAAKSLVLQARDLDPQHPAMHYSLAFLEAYSDRMNEAKRFYKQGFKLDDDGSISLEVEEFIVWVLDTQSGKSQLRFLLGYINFHKKDDAESARRDLMEYISSDHAQENSSIQLEAQKMVDALA